MKRVIFIVLILLMVTPVSAFANKNSSPANTKSINFDGDISLTGVNTKHSKFFEVDEMWDIKEVNLNLIISQSEIIDAARSNLTIYINGNPIHSIKLSDKMKDRDEIKVKVPSSMIKKGFNEVQIKATRRISDEPCTDDYNVANWILIHKESNIDISYNDKISENKLSYYPYPYIKKGPESPNLNIILPDKFNSFEGEGALRVSSYIGNVSKGQDVNVKVYKASDVKKVNNDDFIYIGRYDEIPSEVKKAISSDELNYLSSGSIIKQIISPYNPGKKILLIISNNSEMLVNSSKYMSNKDLIGQVNDSRVFIDKNSKVDDAKVAESSTVSFKDNGYEGIMFEGPFKHEASYTYVVPKDKKLKSQSKIVIKTRYSKNLDFDKSLLSVSVNGVPVGSKKLEMSLANNDLLEITIPEDQLNKNTYNITVRFDLEVKDVYCDFSGKETPFAYILDDSYLTMNTEKIDNVSLSNYPAPFVSSGEFNDLVFVVGGESDVNSLELSANMASYMGKSLEYNTGKVQYKPYSSLSNSDKKNNLIVIGTPTNNDLIKELSESLHIKYNKEFTSFEGNDKAVLEKEYSKNAASIQVFESPYKSENSIMMVTSPKTELINNVNMYFTDSLKSESLKGDAALIDKSSNINTYEFTKEKSKNKNLSLAISENSKVFIASIAIVVVILATGSVFLLRKYKK